MQLYKTLKHSSRVINDLRNGRNKYESNKSKLVLASEANTR